MEVVLHPSLVKCLSSLSILSPRLHRKLWMEQKKAIRATTLMKALGKPTLISAGCSWHKIRRPLESVSGEHHHGSFPYSLERERDINSKSLWENLPLDVCSAECIFHSCCLLLLPCRTLRQRSHQIAVDFIDIVVRALFYHGIRGGADNW